MNKHSIISLIESIVNREVEKLFEQDLDLGDTDNPEGDDVDDIPADDEEPVEEPEEDDGDDTSDEETKDAGAEPAEPETPEAPPDPFDEIYNELANMTAATSDPSDILSTAKFLIQQRFSSYNDAEPIISRLQSDSNPLLIDIGNRLSLFIKGY